MVEFIFYKIILNDGDVFFEMVEFLFYVKGSELKGMYLEDVGLNKKIDYVFVYECCQEKENKDEEVKEKVEKFEDMRRLFEVSFESVGLVIECKDYLLFQVRLLFVEVVKI